jgi:CRISPR-associated endoribonuclease Cas6
VYFPAGKAGNTLRGAFGLLFQEAAHAAGQPRLYERIFQPTLEKEAGPSGLADLPRPFVFRAHHLDGKSIPRDGAFYFDFHLFETREPASEVLAAAFSRTAEAGLGPLRSRARLTAVDEQPVRVDLMPARESIARVRVRFVTPTELKDDGEAADVPEFSILLARIRDRISTLRALYGPGPLVIDFAALRDRAAAVRMVDCAIDRLSVKRRSARTGRSHSIGGFVGEAEYEGNLSEFVPYLNATRWVGVGRHTAWGNGLIETTVLPA